MTLQEINFKDTSDTLHSLETALRLEKVKLQKCPVIPDLVPDHVSAQGWGYVLTAYFLVESALKALAFAHGSGVRKIHSLSALFENLDRSDQNVLREYYTDYRATAPKTLGSSPYDSVDDFLRNLDGGGDGGRNEASSTAWRYFLIEEPRSHDGVMPTVSVEYMHEIVYGCIALLTIHEADSPTDPSFYTHSRRLHEQRAHGHADWQDRQLTLDGYAECGDRLEI
ncbi:MAG: hypothetical protein OXC91_00380, partial [Rhodobacteraceae bacterium]|nr:hypothetical protein [Paracoccaceae bacterium]